MKTLKSFALGAFIAGPVLTLSALSFLPDINKQPLYGVACVMNNLDPVLIKAADGQEPTLVCIDLSPAVTWDTLVKIPSDRGHLKTFGKES